MAFPLNETECERSEDGISALMAGQALITELSDPFNSTACKQSCETRTIDAKYSNMQIFTDPENMTGKYKFIIQRENVLSA